MCRAEFPSVPCFTGDELVGKLCCLSSPGAEGQRRPQEKGVFHVPPGWCTVRCQVGGAMAELASEAGNFAGSKASRRRKVDRIGSNAPPISIPGFPPRSWEGNATCSQWGLASDPELATARWLLTWSLNLGRRYNARHYVARSPTRLRVLDMPGLLVSLVAARCFS